MLLLKQYNTQSSIPLSFLGHLCENFRRASYRHTPRIWLCFMLKGVVLLSNKEFLWEQVFQLSY
ncbi:hypothetical protein [Helicobacter cetorum]|uniref:hypothetical protein n=1 Tax=Helicobacter cetorum TaxID=138563 RepID=UPI0002ECE93E